MRHRNRENCVSSSFSISKIQCAWDALHLGPVEPAMGVTGVEEPGIQLAFIRKAVSLQSQPPAQLRHTHLMEGEEEKTVPVGADRRTDLTDL